MGTLTNMTRTPFDVTCNGKVWLFAPLSLRDLGEMEQWMRSKIVALGAEAARTAGSQEDAEFLMRTAYAAAGSISFASSTGDERTQNAVQGLMTSVDGTLKLLQVSARHHNPVVTLEEVEAFLLDPSVDGNDVLRQVTERSGIAKKINDPKAKAKKEEVVKTA